MAYPKNRKSSSREGIIKKPKEKQIKVCTYCDAEYYGFPGNSYCSRKCLLLRNIQKGQPDECWLWTGYKRPKGGYGEVYLGTKPNRERVLAHRAVYETFNGSAADALVCHSCDNPSCVNPKHLFLGTIQDNMDDRNSKQRQARGESNASSKLSEEDVKMLRKDGRTHSYWANQFGVAESTISEARSGKTWKHVAMEK